MAPAASAKRRRSPASPLPRPPKSPPIPPMSLRVRRGCARGDGQLRSLRAPPPRGRSDAGVVPCRRFAERGASLRPDSMASTSTRMPSAARSSERCAGSLLSISISRMASTFTFAAATLAVASASASAVALTIARSVALPLSKMISSRVPSLARRAASASAASTKTDCSSPTRQRSTRPLTPRSPSPPR